MHGEHRFLEIICQQAFPLAYWQFDDVLAAHLRTAWSNHAVCLARGDRYVGFHQDYVVAAKNVRRIANRGQAVAYSCGISRLGGDEECAIST